MYLTIQVNERNTLNLEILLVNTRECDVHVGCLYVRSRADGMNMSTLDICTFVNTDRWRERFNVGCLCCTTRADGINVFTSDVCN